MRKHFLILMLLTLLPFTAWADGPVVEGRAITSADFSLNAIIYGAANSAPTKTAAATTDGVTFSWDEKYYVTNDCSGTSVTPKGVGTYYVKVVGTAPFTGEVILPFEIQPATLTVTYNGGETIDKIYGNATNPAVNKDNISISGWKYSEETTDNINTIKNSLAYDLTNPAKQDANWTMPAGVEGGDWVAPATTGYALTWTSNTIDNYTIAYPTNVMKITPIALTVGSTSRFSYATDQLDYDYTGTAHLPVYTIKYKNSQNVDETLDIKAGDKNNDFSVSYTWTAPTATPATATYAAEPTVGAEAHAVKNAWAGYYKAQITGHGNYYGTVNFPAKFKGNKAYYQIKKVPLQFYVEDKEKVYDGTAFTLEDAAYQGFGLVAADASVNYSAAVTPSVVGENPLKKDAGTWEITVTVTPENLPAVISNNYTLGSNTNGFWTISKRPVTVTPKDITDNYGAPLTNLATLALTTTNYNTYVTLNGLASVNPGEEPAVLALVAEPDVVAQADEVADPGAEPNPSDYTGGAENEQYISDHAAWVTNKAAYDAWVAYSTYLTAKQAYDDYVASVAAHTAWEAASTAYDTEVTDVLGGFKLAYDAAHTEAGTYENAILVQPKPTIGEEAYEGNYIITAGTPATYKINGRTVNIYPKNANLTYGQKIPESLVYGTAGLTGSMGEGTTVLFRITKLEVINEEETEVDVTVPENGRLDVGSYYVYIDKDNSNIVLPANYDAYTIQTNRANLVINKKDIYAIPAPATLGVGNTVDDLNTIGRASVRFLDSNATEVIDEVTTYTGKNAVEEGDKLSYMLVFNTGVTVSEEEATAGQITEVANGATIKVKEVLPVGNPAVLPAGEEAYYEADNANKNYEFHLETAALTNGAGILVLDRTSDGLLNQLAAADSKSYTVKFANNRTLSAQKWAMMVLPFDTDVATVSAAMKARKSTWTAAVPAYETGYAIVNTLKSTTTSSNIQFELAFGKLPANKPFLVKTSKQVNLNDVVFEGVEIAAPAAEEVPGDTYGGVVFMGLYTDKADLSNTERTIKGNIWYTNRTNIGLQAFEAYLAGCDQAARVFIEDIDDNGTTAIKELNAETGKANNVDGWYTVNGIKLESMPTEKGVYINNGKKVVIK